MGPKLKDMIVAMIGPINSFASGVLFAAAVFLLFPEALFLAGVGHDEEVVGTWTWGTSILLGWFTCFILRHITGALGLDGHSHGGPKEGEEADGNGKVTSGMSTIVSVLLGDFFHNFADGLIIGTAFKVCGSTFGWEIVLVTVAHEAPQEIADMVILIFDEKMHWGKATALNFISGLSTVLGAIITYSSDVGENEEGYILAYGGGIYLYVAVTELGARIMDPPGKEGEKKFMQSGLMLLAFIFGAVCLGLILLDHEHCSAPEVIGEDGEVVSGGHGH
jgi:UTP--glucose-1-phosphate uridylyltransferase